MSSITERLPLTPRRVIAAALLAGFALLATALPASATIATFNNVENCSGGGITYANGLNIGSETDADRVSPPGPCGWVYLQGEYRDRTTGTWFVADPGQAWYQAAWAQVFVLSVDQARNVVHTACNAGGPCPGSWPGRVYTQYP